MQISVNDIKVKPNNDTQKELVYRMDWKLEKILESKEIDLSSLYGDLPLESNIVDLTKKIFKDFNLESISESTYKPNAKHSNYRFYTVTYNDYAYKRNCIETVIHEIAHYFTDIVFGVQSEKHGAFFTSTMKYLFKHYNLLNEQDFDLANMLSTGNKVKFVDEALIKLESLDKEQTELLLSELDFNKENSRQEIEIYTYIEDNKKHRVLKTKETGKSIYTVRKLFKFEIEEIQTRNIDKENLANYVLYSPLFSMDDRGSQVTNWLSYAGRPGFIKNTVSLDEDGKLICLKRVIRGHCKEEIKSIKKDLIKEDKLNNKKYKNATTLRQYRELKKVLQDNIYN